MKRLLGIVVLLATVITFAFAQPPKGVMEVDKVYEYKLKLDSANGTGDTIRVPLDLKWFWSDTITFAIDVTSDSTVIGRSDSIGADLRIQWLTVNGIGDTTTWANWTSVLTKTPDQGQAAWSVAMVRAPSQIFGRLWLEVYNAYPTTGQYATVRVYKIDRWFRRW